MKVFKVVAVKDELTNSFLQPAFLESIEEAQRLFRYQVNNTPIWKDNPEDFSLYHIGTYDEETGTILGINPVKVAGGRAVKNIEEDNDTKLWKERMDK